MGVVASPARACMHAAALKPPCHAVTAAPTLPCLTPCPPGRARRLQAFAFLWNVVPTESGPVGGGEAVVRQQLEHSLQWELYKRKVVADVLKHKEERRRGPLSFR